MSHVYIDKNSNVYNTEIEDGKRINTLITPEKILWALKDHVILEEGFTLRNYFEMVKKYPLLVNLDPWFPDFIIEYNNTCFGQVNGIEEADTELDYLALNKFIEIEYLQSKSDELFELEEKEEKQEKSCIDDLWGPGGYRKYIEGKSQYRPKYEIHESYHFSGIGYSNDEHMAPEGDWIHWAIEYSPIHKLIDLEIRLEYQEITQVEKYYTPICEPIVSGEHNITFFDFVKEIIWELSFAGTPCERDLRIEQIEDSVTECRAFHEAEKA